MKNKYQPNGKFLIKKEDSQKLKLLYNDSPLLCNLFGEYLGHFVLKISFTDLSRQMPKRKKKRKESVSLRSGFLGSRRPNFYGGGPNQSKTHF